MLDGQELIYGLRWELIRETDECVDVPTLLRELSFRFDKYSEEEQKQIKIALIGEENV